MWPFIIVLIVIFSLFSLFMLFSYFAFYQAFYNGKRKKIDLEPLTGEQFDRYDTRSLINKAKEIPFEEVWIKSHDGLNLYGRLYYQASNAPVHIQFNGYKGNGLRDFSGGLQLALKLGANVILVDQRAHGASSGNVISFGIKERFDCLDWVNYAIKRFGEDTKIFLDGVSMGAATVLMASNLPFPKNVIGIIADCPYNNPKDIILKTVKDLGISPKIGYPLLLVGSKVFGHFNLNETNALSCVKETKIPILIIHGNNDTIVPIEMSKKIKEVNEDLVRFVEVDGATHGLSYLQNYDLYARSVEEFTKDCINRNL